MSNFREDLSGYLKESVEASVGKCYESLYTNLFTTHCILPSNLLRTSRRYNLEKQEASVSFQSCGFLKRNLIRLLLDFLNNFPKRFYSNYTFFSVKPTPFLISASGYQRKFASSSSKLLRCYMFCQKAL